MDAAITTLDHIPGRAITRHFDPIFIDVQYGTVPFRGMGEAIKGLFAGNENGLERSLSEARIQGMTKLRATLESLGADALLGLTLQYSVVDRNGSAVITLAGTPVCLAPAHGVH